MMEKGEGPRFYQNIKKREDNPLEEYAAFPSEFLRMMRSLFTSLKKRHPKLRKFSLDQAINYLAHLLNKEIPQM